MKNLISRGKGLLAVSPIGVFMLFYLSVSLATGDFYKMPLAVAFLIAAFWAMAITPGKLRHRIDIFSREAGESNILYMVWIFILAGAYASLVKETGAVETTVNMVLSVLPSGFLLPGLFVAACFISFSIGTSVGTVVALTPLAVEMAGVAGGEVGLFVAAIIGGAFFGDNLSFISDTTIAATRTQGCDLKDKFKANFAIVLPAALVTFGIYLFIESGAHSLPSLTVERPLLIIPYIVIIATALAGVNVVLVLLSGIISAMLTAVFYGFGLFDLCGFMGSGIDSMGNLIIITLLAGGMLGLIKANGGIEYILQCLTRRIRGKRGAQVAIALLAGIVNLCTANNTVAIITVGSISKDVAGRYGVSPRKSASLLDTASCVVQCLIPYGAQTLLATSIAGISPLTPWPWLYYPWLLALMVAISILTGFPKPGKNM